MTDSIAGQEIDFSARRAHRLLPRETEDFLSLKEMHHRLANTLTVLSSVLRRELGRSAPPELRARWNGVMPASSPSAICTGLSWLVPQTITSLFSITSSIFAASYRRHSESRSQFAAMSQLMLAQLQGARCERLGLVIAELVTNAAKHAFHGRDDGLVRVELINRIDSGFWITLTMALGR